jgi:hypothetical protein
MVVLSELRQLIIDSLSPNYLGKYNGDKDAIAIIPHKTFGYNFPPADWKVTGIEVVIIKPSIKVKMSHQGGLKRRQWDLWLKQWQQSVNLSDATELMVDGLLDNKYQIQSPVYIPYNERLGIIASAKIPIIEFIQRIGD